MKIREKGWFHFLQGPKPDEMEQFAEVTAAINLNRAKIFSFVLIVFFGINIIIDVLHFNKLGQTYYFYLDCILIVFSLAAFLYTVLGKRPGNRIVIGYAVFVLCWAAVLTAFQNSLIPILIASFIFGVLLYIRIFTALLFYLLSLATVLLTVTILGNWDSYDLVMVIELIGIILWSWVASRIIYASKLQEFRSHNEIKKISEDQEKIIQERTSTLKEKLEEREVLLREIHHRVKNNLQILVSMFTLSLELKGKAPDEDLINDNINRILSMAMIHDCICTSENLSAIGMSSYIPDIVQSVVANNENRARIEITFNIDENPLYIDTAMNVGIILTEALTSMLHFLSKDSRKRNSQEHIDMAVTFSVQDDTSKLIVIGSTENKKTGPWPEKDIHVYLIDTLSEQINGYIAFGNNEELTFTLTF